MAKPRKSEKTAEIERVIAYLFAHKGYHSTTMRDIAREVGMHQSSLYYYFASKEDILFKLMNDAVDAGMAGLEEICNGGHSPEDKLKKVFRFYIQHYTGDKARHILLENEMNSLNKRHQRILYDKQRRYVNLIRSIIIELFDKQRIKSIHPTIATFAFFGMVNYTTKWYRPEGPVRPEKLAGMFTEIMARGLSREDLQ